MKKRSPYLLALTALLSVFIVLSFASTVKSETGAQQARVTQETYSGTIYAGMMDTWTFTVHNVNCSEGDQAEAQFFFRFYVDNDLFFDEFSSAAYKTWSCNIGSTVTRNFRVNSWNPMRPVVHDVRIELYWYHNGTAILEDVASFTVAVALHISLQDIFATGYLIVYLIACFLLFAYNYAEGLEE